jgi:hypothetical protein
MAKPDAKKLQAENTKLKAELTLARAAASGLRRRMEYGEMYLGDALLDAAQVFQDDPMLVRVLRRVRAAQGVLAEALLWSEDEEGGG